MQEMLRDTGLIPEWGRSPGGEHGNPLQYSCLENPMDRAAWQATVHGVAKSRTRLSDFTPFHLCVYRLQQAISDMSVSKGCGERFGDYPTLQKGVRELNDLLWVVQVVKTFESRSSDPRFSVVVYSASKIADYIEDSLWICVHIWWKKFFKLHKWDQVEESTQGFPVTWRLKICKW